MSQTDDLKVTVLVACRNEAETIILCLKRINAACPDARIIVVDGGDDSTEALVKSFAKSNDKVLYIKNENDCGKGHAIQVGLAHTTTDIVAQIDADLQFYPEDLPPMVAMIRSGAADMVLGSRFLASSTRLPGSTPLLRTLGNKAMNLYISLLLGKRISDALAGMKVWKTEITRCYPLSSNNYSYEAELVLIAAMHQYRLHDHPVTTEARKHGHSSVRVFQVGLTLLKDILRLRIHHTVTS